MRFAKGTSGNAAGRPSGSGTAEIKALLRPHDRLLIQKLKDLLSHQDGKIQMEAVKLAFLYRWGKPAEQAKTGEDGQHGEAPGAPELETMGEELSEAQIRALQTMATGGKPEDYKPEDHPTGSAKQATTSQPPKMAREPAAPSPPPSATPSPSPSPPSGAPSKDDPLQGYTPDARRTAVLAAIGILPP